MMIDKDDDDDDDDDENNDDDDDNDNDLTQLRRDMTITNTPYLPLLIHRIPSLTSSLISSTLTLSQGNGNLLTEAMLSTLRHGAQI